jgi:hypothetical protein
MNKQAFKIIESIVMANNGITIESIENNSVITPEFKSGYFVSIKSFESKSAIFDFQSFNAYLESNQFIRDLLPDYKKLFIGVWFNANDNLYYYDLNQYFKDLDSAITYGKQQKQIAIYDIAKNDSIELVYNHE